MVYHGPREEVVGFFGGLGFTIPARKGVADFLQEVTSRKDQQVSSVVVLSVMVVVSWTLGDLLVCIL